MRPYRTNASIPKELEGSKIKELESNKQGDYFESMKLWSPPKLRIYVDMDGVMIVEIMPNEWKAR